MTSPLVHDLLALGGGLDREACVAAVQALLRCRRPLPEALLDPDRSPAYWCVPPLVGDYGGAGDDAIAADLPRYLSACLVRHFFYERDRWFDLDDDLVGLVGDAYEAAADPATTFADRFAAKCRSWTVVLAYGTQTIEAHARPDDHAAALAAVVAVYSGVQVLDDWHDRADDLARGHWNMWTDEPAGQVLRAVEALLDEARRRTMALRPHLLRDVLVAQLHDTAAELADLVTVSAPAPGAATDPVAAGARLLAGRLGADTPGLWRDFAVPGVSAGSTECVSAFMATVLAPIPDARPAARTVASTLLAHLRPTGGWGYRGDVVEDTDSTAWVVLSVATTGVAPAPGVIDRCVGYLLAHRRPDGGFATYDEQERSRLTVGDLPAWSDTDTTVTCSALLALHAVERLEAPVLGAGCAYVADHVTDQGLPSLWWDGPAYGTWMAVLLFTTIDRAGHRRALARARDLLRGSRLLDPRGGDGSVPNAFDTALAVKSLCRLGHPGDARVIRSATAALASFQDDCGQWPGGARMLAPGAHQAPGPVLRDKLLTTALAVSALHEARNTPPAV